VVFLLYALALALALALAHIKIGFGAVLWFGLDSFGSNGVSPNVNFNKKNPHLQQLKNLANYSIQI
jgi:hypothetical protein